MCVPCNCNNHSERCNSMNGACQVIDHSFLYRHDVRRYHTYRCRENRNLFICIYVFIYRTVSIILWECIVKDVSRATTEMPPLECKVTVRSEEFSCLPYCILYLYIFLLPHIVCCVFLCADARVRWPYLVTVSVQHADLNIVPERPYVCSVHQAMKEAIANCKFPNNYLN